MTTQTKIDELNETIKAKVLKLGLIYTNGPDNSMAQSFPEPHCYTLNDSPGWTYGFRVAEPPTEN